MSLSPIERESRLAQLRQRFLESATTSVAVADPVDPERLRRTAHDLRGTGGAYGYPDISTMAGALEDAILAGAGFGALRAGIDKLAEAVRLACRRARS